MKRYAIAVFCVAMGCDGAGLETEDLPRIEAVSEDSTQQCSIRVDCSSEPFEEPNVCRFNCDVEYCLELGPTQGDWMICHEGCFNTYGQPGDELFDLDELEWCGDECDADYNEAKCNLNQQLTTCRNFCHPQA